MPFIFDVKVVPSSGQNKWKLDKSGSLKCYLKSPPEQGRANAELIKIISKALKIAQSEVAIVTGAVSRIKKIRVELDITLDQLLAKLGIERQISIFD